MQADTNLVRSIKHINNPRIPDGKAKSKKKQLQKKLQNTSITEQQQQQQPSKTKCKRKEERNTRFVKQWMGGEKK